MQDQELGQEEGMAQMQQDMDGQGMDQQANIDSQAMDQQAEIDQEAAKAAPPAKKTSEAVDKKLNSTLKKVRKILLEKKHSTRSNKLGVLDRIIERNVRNDKKNH